MAIQSETSKVVHSETSSVAHLVTSSATHLETSRPNHQGTSWLGHLVTQFMENCQVSEFLYFLLHFTGQLLISSWGNENLSSSFRYYWDHLPLAMKWQSRRLHRTPPHESLDPAVSNEDNYRLTVESGSWTQLVILASTANFGDFVSFQFRHSFIRM